MQKLLFPILIARLSLLLFTFLGQLIWHLHSRKILIFLSLAFILANSLSYISIQKTAAPQTVFRVNQQFLKDELDKQLTILEKQPTHRDALYNLSIIYAKIGSQQKSDQYLEKAKYQDPNHPLFSN